MTALRTENAAELTPRYTQAQPSRWAEDVEWDAVHSPMIEQHKNMATQKVDDQHDVTIRPVDKVAPGYYQCEGRSALDVT